MVHLTFHEVLTANRFALCGIPAMAQARQTVSAAAMYAPRPANTHATASPVNYIPNFSQNLLSLLRRLRSSNFGRRGPAGE